MTFQKLQTSTTSRKCRESGHVCPTRVFSGSIGAGAEDEEEPPSCWLPELPDEKNQLCFCMCLFPIVWIKKFAVWVEIIPPNGCGLLLKCQNFGGACFKCPSRSAHWTPGVLGVGTSVLLEGDALWSFLGGMVLPLFGCQVVSSCHDESFTDELLFVGLGSMRRFQQHFQPCQFLHTGPARWKESWVYANLHHSPKIVFCSRLSSGSSTHTQLYLMSFHQNSSHKIWSQDVSGCPLNWIFIQLKNIDLHTQAVFVEQKLCHSLLIHDAFGMLGGPRTRFQGHQWQRHLATWGACRSALRVATAENIDLCIAHLSTSIIQSVHTLL